MFDGPRMILKRGIQISQTGVAGVACLGKQCRVAETQLRDQVPGKMVLLLPGTPVPVSIDPSCRKADTQYSD
jgi:hypothetical protein